MTAFGTVSRRSERTAFTKRRVLLYSSYAAAWCITLFGGFASHAAAQDVQWQIETDVWIPLLAASGAFDADAFLAVQSPDFVRLVADRNEIYALDRYGVEIRDGFNDARERGIVRTSEVRFTERIGSDNLAYETGYFRSRATMPDGEVRTRYVRFEIVLRKEGGRWKILLDKDTAERGMITEEAFRAAAPMRHAGAEVST